MSEFMTEEEVEEYASLKAEKAARDRAAERRRDRDPDPFNLDAMLDEGFQTPPSKKSKVSEDRTTDPKEQEHWRGGGQRMETPKLTWPVQSDRYELWIADIKIWARNLRPGQPGAPMLYLALQTELRKLIFEIPSADFLMSKSTMVNGEELGLGNFILSGIVWLLTHLNERGHLRERVIVRNLQLSTFLSQPRREGISLYSFATEYSSEFRRAHDRNMLMDPTTMGAMMLSLMRLKPEELTSILTHIQTGVNPTVQ